MWKNVTKVMLMTRLTMTSVTVTTCSSATLVFITLRTSQLSSQLIFVCRPGVTISWDVYLIHGGLPDDRTSRWIIARRIKNRSSMSAGLLGCFQHYLNILSIRCNTSPNHYYYHSITLQLWLIVFAVWILSCLYICIFWLYICKSVSILVLFCVFLCCFIVLCCYATWHKNFLRD